MHKNLPSLCCIFHIHPHSGVLYVIVIAQYYTVHSGDYSQIHMCIMFN